MSIRRAVIFSTLQRYYGFVMAFISTIVVSRLLSPADLGAFSVAMSVAGVATSFREFGASAFLIRSPTLEKHHESCAFGLTLLLGGGLGLVLVIVAKPLARFFRTDEVADLVYILSLNLFLLPFGTVNNALIRRQMQFDLLARINVIALTLGFLVTLGLASLGFGAYSLAWGAVALSLFSSGLSILWGPAPAIIRPRFTGGGDIIRFGSQTTGLSVLWDISSRYSDFLLGRMHGLAATGLMSRAAGLANNVNDVLLSGFGAVALSYFSQLQREKGDPLATHLRLAALVTGLGWPAFVGLAFFAEPLTLALYGENWLGIVLPLQILCLQYCLGLPFSFQYELVMAKGSMDKQVKAIVFIEIFRIVAVTVGAMWGLIGVAVALVVTQLFATLSCSLMVWPMLNVGWADYWVVIKTNLPITAVTIACCSGALALANQWSASYVQLILVVCPVVAVCVLAGYAALRHPLFVEVMKLLKGWRTA